MIVYSVSNRDTFTDIEGWMEEIRKYTHESIKVLLIGNKCDLEDEREVPTEEGIVYFNAFLNNLGIGKEVEGGFFGNISKKSAKC